MFECKHCQLLKNLLDDERVRNHELQTQLLMFVRANLHKPVTVAMADESEYYGVDDDMVEYNEFGDKIVVKADAKQ